MYVTWMDSRDKRIACEESTSKGQASNSTSERLETRASVFLPEPPSFDLTIFKKREA
jgi:hypothetical protein